MRGGLEAAQRLHQDIQNVSCSPAGHCWVLQEGTARIVPPNLRYLCRSKSIQTQQVWREKQMQFMCPTLNIWDVLELPPGYLSGGQHPMLQQADQQQRKSFDLVSVRTQCLFHFQWDTIFIQTLFYQLLFANIAKGCLCLPPADRASHGSLNFIHHSAGICPLQVTLLTGLALDICFNTFGLEFWFTFK